MLHRCSCALGLLLSLAGCVSAAEHKGTLTALKPGESITVRIRGEQRTFPVDADTVFARWLKTKAGSKETRVRPAVLAHQLAKAKKKGVLVEIVTREHKGKEVVRAVYFDLHNKPAKKQDTKRPSKDE